MTSFSRVSVSLTFSILMASCISYAIWTDIKDLALKPFNRYMEKTMKEKRSSETCKGCDFHNHLGTSSDNLSLNDLATDTKASQSFKATRIRIFDENLLMFRNYQPPPAELLKSPDDNSCTRWAVVTTIFNASESVQRLARLPDWSLVIVADVSTPTTYDVGWTAGNIPSTCNKRIEFLSVERQMEEPWRSIDVPWRSFARKNIGFLYAVLNGARIIYDFDDDNELIFFGPGSQILPLEDAPILSNAIPKCSLRSSSEKSNCSISVHLPHRPKEFPYFNPYPSLGCPYQNCWPRGFPLRHIRNESSYEVFKFVNKTIPVNRLGVLQSLAQHQPDVDAIFRMTKTTPFRFKRTLPGMNPVLIPKGAYTPYNAQATLHFYNAFWALYLPSSVPGRVSDIWRSYVAQRLFSDLKLRFGFLPRPLVIQDRNQHDYLNDFVAEERLYDQSESLIDWLMLEFNSSSCSSLPCLIEAVWIGMYEYGFVEADECHRAQSWIDSLIHIGYQFPPLDTQVARPVQLPKQFSDTLVKELWRKSIHSPVHKKSDEPVTPHPPYKHRQCTATSNKLVLWAPDFHDGTRVDMTSIVARMGQTAIVAGSKKRRISHPHIFDIPNLQIIGEGHLSPSVVEHVDLTPGSGFKLKRLMEEAVTYYLKDSLFRTSNAVICSFIASICDLFIPLNKTIIFAPAHRYNIGRCTVDHWTALNKRLHRLADTSKDQQPKHFVAAMSIYDREYLKYYTGLSPVLLESSSIGYTGDFDYAEYLSKGEQRSQILLMGEIHKIDLPHLNQLATDLKFVSDRSLYPHWTFSDLAHHRAIVYMPYSVMSYKFTELYSLSIPLFVPSLRFFLDKNQPMEDRPVSAGFYCNNPQLDEQMPQHPNSTHLYNPNTPMTKDPEAELYWLQFADFYQWPHVTTFDSLEDLVKRVRSTDFADINRLMRKENQRRLDLLESNWCNIIRQLQSPSEWVAPKSPQEAVASWI